MIINLFKYKHKKDYIVQGNKNLEVRLSVGKGRGVFTSKPIKKGELIEECPVLLIEIETLSRFDGLKMGYYVFKIKDQPDKAALLLGYGSLYNHASPANAETYFNSDKMTFDVVAVRAIVKDEEITINYNGSFDSDVEISFLDKVDEVPEVPKVQEVAKTFLEPDRFFVRSISGFFER